MTFAAIDTNVLVAALLTKHADAATARVLRASLDGRVAMLVSAEILAEYREVLARPKLQLPAAQVAEILAAAEQSGVGTGRVASEWAFPDESDRVFYEVALAGRVFGAMLVTGNLRHYPAADFVVSPARFCEIAGL